MHLQLPPYLKNGSVIGITCPAGYVARERVAHAITVLQQWGYEVRTGETVGTEHFYFSGTDSQRFHDLQAMLDDPAIDAIMMGRGGYGMSRIIDQLDFTAFTNRPKWICGFSDITVLHNHIQELLGIATIHGPMCGAFKPETDNAEHILSVKAALSGAPLSYTIPSSIYYREGVAEGIATGGNIAILAHLTGSVSEVNTDGKILMLEDIGEYLYNLDRLMLNLKRAGKLKNLAGLIIGGLTDMLDTERPFGQTAEELVWDKVKEYNYPVCFNAPFGHQDINYALPLGMLYRLDVRASGSQLVQLSS
ncbi:MAG: LD-carboxypeptidase [Taibaiella sp.]|nr:LD-carboxypeptidase [Taibaiella sp.]